MEERVGALLTAVLERNGLTADDLISIWFTATPDLHSDFPAAAALQARYRGRPPHLRPGAGHRGRHAPGRADPRAHRSRTAPAPTSPHVYLGAARGPAQGHRPVRDRPRHRNRPDRHLRRPGPRPARRHRPPRRPRPRAGPHGRRAGRRHRQGPRRPRRPGDRRRTARPCGPGARRRDAPGRGPAATWTSPASRAAPAASWRRSAWTSPRTSAPTPCPAGRSPARWPPPATSSRAAPGCSPPTRDTDTEVLNLALELVSHCRAVPVVMDADAHDRAVALVSHMPHLVSSMVAARLEHAEEAAVLAVRAGASGT